MNSRKPVTKQTEHHLGYYFRGFTASELPYYVDLNDWGVLYQFTDWCRINCSHPWGWFFKMKPEFSQHLDHVPQQDEAIMTFEDEEEAILFKLTWVDK